MKPNTERLRNKYMDNPPERMISEIMKPLSVYFFVHQTSEFSTK